MAGSFTLPDTIANGRHKLNLFIDKISGAQPAYRDSTDTVNTVFTVYRNKVDRNYTLLEHFTSQNCRYCPWGVETLTALNENRSDIAWVSVHGDMGTGRDAFSSSDTRTLVVNLAGNTYPTLSIDREHIDGNNVATTFLYTGEDNYTFSAENSAYILGEIIDSLRRDVPSFATINLEPSYDASTRQLVVNVSGDKVSDFDDIIGTGALNVYLTEDSLVAVQNNQGNYDRDFVHNHVLRTLLTAVDGTDIEWNGNHYSMQFSCQLKRAWKPSNMHIIAAINYILIGYLLRFNWVSFTT